jgi:hypothetical protein
VELGCSAIISSSVAGLIRFTVTYRASIHLVAASSKVVLYSDIVAAVADMGKKKSEKNTRVCGAVGGHPAESGSIADIGIRIAD